MHKSLFTIALLLSSFAVSFSQTLAVTEKGDTIYVFENGTWSFDKDEEFYEDSEVNFLDSELSIDTIGGTFKYSKNAKKEVTNSQGQFKIRYNDELWKRVPPASLNDDAEFAFESKETDLWCVVISEETQIAKDMLYKIAQKTIEENTGSSTIVLKTELRNVNGHEILRGVVNANYSGINFIFDTYYFSNELGSVQFTVWTSDNLWEKHENTILDLLNGFVVQ